jgi:hypothetical protein
VSHEFRDQTGRAWIVNVTVPDLKRVRESTGEALGKMDLQKLLEMVADPERFVDVLFALVGGQRVDVTGEDFGRSLGGDSLESAQTVFLRAWADFCPSRGRTLLLTLAEKAEAHQQAAMDAAMQQLSTWNGSDMNSPAPSDVPPTAGPSGS